MEQIGRMLCGGGMNGCYQIAENILKKYIKLGESNIL